MSDIVENAPALDLLKLHPRVADDAPVSYRAKHIRALFAEIDRLEKERHEAVKELRMKWCMSCGTLTNDDDCDCTMYGHDDSLQELRPYIEEYKSSIREQWKEAEARACTLAERAEELEAVLKLAEDKLFEINPSNYTHDDVCKLNDASVEVLLAIDALHSKAASTADGGEE